ncbi:uncharacterized protein LOC109821889 [Asparagus officinalis]|uniref:uncharacterized protein LOC109821889 n=1 Tax=Asparagus officinalis TaxID=4686 RepID=UPI00098E4859|nr:uncharacterized protein LOC109821889 [Asparagus officinalis]
MALAVIYQAIPEETMLQVAGKETAREVWEALRTMHVGVERVKEVKLQALRWEFENLRMGDAQSVDEFATKLTTLVNQIRSLGETMEESHVVKKLLHCVPPKFLQIAATMEQFDDLKTMQVDEVIGALKAHEERYRDYDDWHEQALLIRGDPKPDAKSSRGKEFLSQNNRGHGRGYSRGRGHGRGRGNGGRGSSTSTRRGTNGGHEGGRDKSMIKCFNCNNFGHYASECRSKHRDEETNLTRVLDEEPALLLSECAGGARNTVLLNEKNVIPKLQTDEKAPVGSDVWYLDNGASNHMTGQRSMFKHLDESIHGKVKFGDGSTVQIKGKGSILFLCKNGEQRLLREVYFIPSLCNNIISLGQLSKDGSRTVMCGSFLCIYDRNGRLLIKVKRSPNRLYKVLLETCEPVCLTASMEDPAWLWHARLGHVSFQALKMMGDRVMAHGIPKINHPMQICEGCLVAKQTRNAFPS